MKIYVAGKYEKKDMIQRIYVELRKRGHEISYDWTTHKNIKPYTEHPDEAKQYAENELKGILASDAFIFISDEEKSATLPMEFGAALAHCAEHGKPIIYAVGEWNARSPWFFNSNVKRRESVELVFQEILSAC